MRRPLVALGLLSCFGLVACEDGPTQTFTPAPPGAGSIWNDGQTPGVVDPTVATFNNQGGGTNKQVICNAAKEAAVWKAMVQAEIIPPTRAGNLDMAGVDSTGKIETWQGLTIEAAEQVNCQSTSIGDYFGDGNQDNAWGDNDEVIAEYLVSNHLIDEITLNLGYTGAMTAMSRDGQHTFVLPLGIPMTMDNQPFTLDWVEGGGGLGQGTKFKAEVNAIYDALLATFLPGLPPTTDCQGTGACIIGNFGQVAYMFFPILGIGPEVANFTAGPPTNNTFVQMQMYSGKILPYSLANPFLKLDQPGVTALAGLLGANVAPNACSLQMGLPFSTFLSECINVTGDPTKDMVNYNKEVGALSHDDETWTFNVAGVDLNYKDMSLGATDIVLDKTLPAATDIAVNFRVDQSAIGAIANDLAGNTPGAAKDLHGAGLVYLQYAQNVQNTLNGYLAAAGVPTHQLGAPECTTGVDSDKLNFPAGCTGFEGIVTASPTSFIPSGGTTPTNTSFAANALGTNVLAIDSHLSLGLKAGHPAVAFCLDADGNLTVDSNTGRPVKGGSYTHCTAPQGAQGDLFSTSFARVLQVMGQGSVANLPVDAQDVRFFWKQYVLALVQYMESVGGDETEVGVAAVVPDPDDLFFDSQGAGQFEIGEYVDRRFASITQPPTDINVTADVKNGIFNDYSFSRELYRGENAIYSAVLEKPGPTGDGLGQEHTALLTNVFGSTVLSTGWTGSADGTYSAWQCATANGNNPTSTDATVKAAAQAVIKACGGQLVPLDASGNLRLLRYPGAFAGGATAFALGPTPIKIVTTFPSLQQATVSIPLYETPYAWSTDSQGALANSGTSLGPISPLIPWTPKQSGIGFPIPVTGTLNKFIETGNLDFSGTTISASVDFDAVIDPMTMQPKTDGSLQFLAVETTDFLGEVFVCQDSNTGDLLGARMYDTVAGIQSWFLSHPGAYASCGMITTYSPYDNYADFITSVANGVRLNITQGGGYGRVVDVTLFVPGQ